MSNFIQLNKVKDILLSTNNPGKFKELKEILPKKINYYRPKDFNLKEPVENGKSFQSNAKIKSLYASKKTGLISVSDDSGLEISKINNKPGIYSARWAGKKKDFNLAIKKIYKLLLKKNALNSKARFVCCISVGFPNGKSHEFTGYVYGKISFPPRGKKGFGYDPIFIPNGETKTFAQMSKQKKNLLSHRYQAYLKLKKFFRF